MSTQKPKLMVENISCVIPEAESIGGLFLGNTYGAQNSDILREYGIRAVLTTSIETRTLSGNKAVNYDPSAIPFHLKIQAHDKQNYEIIDHLEECLNFIHKYRQITNVFVHCYAGVSRSVTIVVAYLMKYWKWNVDTSIAFVQSKRVVAKPNPGFMEQLRKYEMKFIPAPSRPVSTSIKTGERSFVNGTGTITGDYPKTSSGLLAPSDHHYHHHNPSLQSLSSTSPSFSNFGFTSSPSLKRPEQAPTRKHAETPIPKILTQANKNNQSNARKQEMRSPNNYYSNSTSHKKNNMVEMSHNYNPNNYNFSLATTSAPGFSSQGIQNTKSSKGLIRPKDLPGYKG